MSNGKYTVEIKTSFGTKHKDIQYNSAVHHRHSIRFLGYDYSQPGAYFVTLCIQNRECLFGNVIKGKMQLSDAGKMVQTVWGEIPIYYSGIDIDEFIIMPNHIHGIIVIVGVGPRAYPDLEQPQRVAPTLSLSTIIHRFKTLSTKRYGEGVHQYGWQTFPGRLWQRNYWERIVRNELELNKMREYIYNNPAQWETDPLAPYIP